MDKIWVPESYADKQLTSLQRALREYDERLTFGRNEQNGDWCVFYKTDERELVPVLGFQNTIPTPEAMLERVRQADTKRHTDWLEENINKPNERLRQEFRERADDASYQLAEGMESFLHAQGKTPYMRSFSKAVESRRTGGSRAAER